MTINKGQLYGGVFITLAGVSALLGRTLGWHRLWFLYPIATGLLMLLAPWDNGSLRARRGVRIGGIWVLMGGVIGAVATLTNLGWRVAGPLRMIGAGLILLFVLSRFHRTEGK